VTDNPSMAKRFLLFVLVLWLPLQTVAAFAMPYCHRLAAGAGHPPAAAVQDAAQGVEHAHHAQQGQHDTCHQEHASPACHDPADGDGSAAGTLCDDCSLCHLAHGGTLLNPAAARYYDARAFDYTAPPLPGARSHIPEPSLEPPIAA